eukprot:gene17957-biopygen2374
MRLLAEKWWGTWKKPVSYKCSKYEQLAPELVILADLRARTCNSTYCRVQRNSRYRVPGVACVQRNSRYRAPGVACVQRNRKCQILRTICRYGTGGDPGVDEKS